jgi:hypothetical protein
MNSIKRFGFADGILLVSLLLIGGFHEYISCALSVAMSIWLLVRMAQSKQLRIRKDFLTSAVVAICFGYGLTCIWAIDWGMAFIGFLKFLPLLLYLFCLQQESGTGRVLEVLPWFGAVLAVISAIGMQFPAVERLFAVAGRLAGTFQYPNTFAVFLLACQLLLLRKPGKKILDYAVLLVLVAALLYTGSRTAFIVALLANVAMLLSMTRKKVRLISLAAMGGVCLVGLLLALNPNSVLHRYLNISLTQSTFVGRLLYWVDALPLLLKYPLGMGYMGYFYVQQSIQTGVYSVAYIHNDFLQLALDVGLLPIGLFVAALVIWFCKKTVPLTDKIIVGAICLHSLFDFNLQFIGVFFLLLLLLSQEQTDKILILKPRLLLKLSFGVAVLAGLYIGTALLLAHFGAREVSDGMYPYNTQNKLAMLEQETDLETANALAEDILKQNTHFYAPYSIKVKYCYSKGDFGAVIQNQRAALERNPFGHTEYEDYCKMLITGIDLYKKAGDTKSAEICEKELLAVYRRLSENAQRLSPLGKMIKDQPITVLSPEIREYVKGLGE